MRSIFIFRLPFIFSLLCLIVPSYYAHDTSHDEALGQLRKDIEILISQKNPAPIQAILKRYKIRTATNFSGVKNESQSQQIARFLPKRRPIKVSLSEWQALRKSNITIEPGENGSCEFALLDLDEDGLRDLIVHSYTGGTGLFSYDYVFRQSGGRFITSNSPASSNESTDTGGDELYSINGRGADQEAKWVRVNGRVYLAYRNGEYGKDELLLLRAFPLPIADKSKGLIVEYSYRHTLPSLKTLNQQMKGKILGADLYAALQKGLNRVSDQASLEEEINYGECPVPQNLNTEQKEQYAWSWFGPPHYTFDVVADFPVFVGNQCFAARVVNFKSSYLKGDVYIATALWFLRRPDAEQEEFDINSKRSPQRVRIGEIHYPFDEAEEE